MAPSEEDAVMMAPSRDVEWWQLLLREGEEGATQQLWILNLKAEHVWHHVGKRRLASAPWVRCREVAPSWGGGRAVENPFW